MKYIYYIGFLLASVLPMTAQEKHWTLNECILYAIEHSPRTNKQVQQNKIYHQNYLEAIGKLLPSITAGSSASFNFGRNIDSKTNTYTDNNTFSNNYDLSASLILFDGLASYTRVNMNKVNKLLGKQQLQQEKDMIAYETMEKYFNVLYNIAMVKIAEEQLEETNKNHKQIKRMEELGIKGFPDVAEIEAKLAEDTYNLTKQRNLLTIAVLLLKEKMNFPIEEELLVSKIDDEILITKIEDTPYNIYNEALAYNPKARVANSQYNSQKLSYRMSKGNLMPTISMRAGVGTNFGRVMDGSDYMDFKEQLKMRRGQYVTFSISIPIFNGFSRTASVQRAKAQMYIAQADRDETHRTLYNEITQALADANGQVDEYNQAIKQNEASKVAHNVNKREYDEGLIDPIILHTSANRFLKTQAEVLNARFKYLLKKKLVNYYKGEPFYLPEQQSITE